MSLWTRLFLLCVAGTLFTTGAWLTNRERSLQLEGELRRTKSELERIHIEHRDSLDAITNALDAREVIHEQAKLREERLRKALSDFPYADVHVSDDLRMCLQGDENCEIPAAGSAAQGHDNTGPLKNQDGR